MLGALLTLLFAAAATGLGLLCLRRVLVGLDPALRVGVGGLAGLGLLGLLTFGIGMTPLLAGPGGLVLILLVASLGLVGLLREGRATWHVSLPSGLSLLFPVAIAVGALLALISVLAPADVNEWDTLAYHLAVPKIWLQEGKILFIPHIHQSNFPFLVDNLYLWGLSWGGQSGAKAFQLAFYLLGGLSIFGMARQQYGAAAGWWGALAFATVPSVLWEAGTTYIDMSHGLYAGFGILFGALVLVRDEKVDRQNATILAALMLGFAAGSKYTGLQTVLAVALALGVGLLLLKRPGEAIGRAAVIGIATLALAAPWLVRNVMNTGNPVYPFFYEQVGSTNWDQRRADIYRNEQKSFGIGSDPASLGHAVLGLAYQPGRYVNPGQTLGLGSPLGALGMAVLATLMLWLISGRSRRFEGVVLGALIVSILIWFALSQQSRYIITWAVPVAVLAGGAVERLKLGRALAGVIGLQAVVTLFLMVNLRTGMQAGVVFGDVSREEYQQRYIPFYEAATAINTEVEGGKVALYDEVFGYLLDVPYFWANPGHSTVIPYDEMESAEAYVEEMKGLGFTHIYLNPMTKERELRDAWLGSMGMIPAEPLSAEQRQELLSNWENKWMVLLSDAAAEDRIEPVQVFRGGILFRIR